MLKRILLASAMMLAFTTPAMAQDAAAGCTSCGVESSAASARMNGKPILLAQAAPRPGRTIGNPIGNPVIIDNPKGDRGPCCPPITSGTWAQYFVPQQSPGKNVTQTYGYNFVASPALDAQMIAYAPFAALWTPTSKHANSVALVAEVRSWDTNMPPANWTDPGSTDVYPGRKQLRAWFTNGNIWTGAGFEQTLNDNQAIAPLHFNPNKSYMIKLSLILNYKDTPHDTPRDNSWYQLDLNCMTKFVKRGSMITGKVASNAGLDQFKLQD